MDLDGASDQSIVQEENPDKREGRCVGRILLGFETKRGWVLASLAG